MEKRSLTADRRPSANEWMKRRGKNEARMASYDERDRQIADVPDLRPFTLTALVYSKKGLPIVSKQHQEQFVK